MSAEYVMDGDENRGSIVGTGKKTLKEMPTAVVDERLTVIETIYHQAVQEEATSTEGRFCRNLKTKGEQPYSRRTKVGENWTPLDLGWLADNVGMLHIQNNEGVFKQVNPTKEERDASARKVLEICHEAGPVTDDPNDPLEGEPQWMIPPTESFRGTPVNPKWLFIRSRSGECKFTITVYPA